MLRPSSVPRWTGYVLLFGLYLTIRGYHSRDGDQAYRLPLLLHRQDPAKFATDPFVLAVDGLNPHRGYLALLDLASRPFGLSFGLFALFAVTFGLTCFGIDRLARAVWPGGTPRVGMVAVVLVLLAKAGNIGTNHLFEAMLLDRLIGFALGWVALALAIEGETWRPSLLVGLAAVVHPSVGLQLGGLLGASWVAWSLGRSRTGQPWRRTALGLATLTLALLPGALPTLGQRWRLFEGLSAEEFRLLGVELQMAQHMVPTLWRKGQWLAWGAYVVFGIVALARGREAVAVGDRAVRARFAILGGVLLAGLGVAYGAIEGVGSLSLTVFQPFRMATIARGLALIAVAGRVRWLWSRGDFASRARLFLLAAGLGGDWAFVVAVAVELSATVAEAVGRGRAWVIPVGLLLYGLFFLSRHDTERGQVAMLVGLGAAGVVTAARGRLATGWNPRRLVVAAVACWGVPVVALVGGSGLPLVERCRFGEVPTDDVERLGAWAREHTPSGARFITPPGPKTFRLWSGRSVAFNRAASPYHAAGLKDWAARFRAHVGFEGTTAEFVHAYLADRHGIEARFNRLTSDELAELAADQGADHILASAPGLLSGRPGPLRLLKVEGRYAIYRVEPTWLASRRGGPVR